METSVRKNEITSGGNAVFSCIARSFVLGVMAAIAGYRPLSLLSFIIYAFAVHATYGYCIIGIITITL